MSLWSIFAEASFVNKLILLLLLALSILSWGIIFERWLYFRNARRADTRLLASLKRLPLTVETLHRQSARAGKSPTARVYLAAEKTVWNQGNENRQYWADALHLERDLLRGEAERGLSVLASVAGAAPFIGLLGTVWGVMIAFFRLGSVQGQPALEVVGPPIAEALVATAAGLFAAIPATIAYNAFLASLRQMLRRCDQLCRRFILSKDAERVR